MAAFPSIPMDEFIHQYPQVLKDWIEQDLGWEINDIKDIMIDCYAFNVDVSVTSEIGKVRETRKHQFSKLPNGEWAKFSQNGWAQYEASEYSYVVGKPAKQEITDEDAFDLMDSIRDELWK